VEEILKSISNINLGQPGQNVTVSLPKHGFIVGVSVDQFLSLVIHVERDKNVTESVLRSFFSVMPGMDIHDDGEFIGSFHVPVKTIGYDLGKEPKRVEQEYMAVWFLYERDLNPLIDEMQEDLAKKRELLLKTDPIALKDLKNFFE